MLAEIVYSSAIIFTGETEWMNEWMKSSPYPSHPLMSACWVAQSCPTLCDPTDCSPPDSSVHGILQARILEWVAISFSRGSSWLRDSTLHCRQILYCLSHQGSPLTPSLCYISWYDCERSMKPTGRYVCAGLFFSLCVWLGGIFPRIPVSMIPG